jgi:hypothetical protein
MKLPGNRLRMSSGEVRKFKSKKKRANFERVAQAYKHGWRPGMKEMQRKG